MSKHTDVLSEAMKKYYAYGWHVIPGRINDNKIDLGKIARIPSSDALEEQLNWLQSFVSSDGGYPANALLMMAGHTNNTLSIRCTAPYNKSAKKLKEQFDIDIMLHPCYTMSINYEDSRTYLFNWDIQLNNVDISKHNSSNITFMSADDYIVLPPSKSYIRSKEKNQDYTWFVPEGTTNEFEAKITLLDKTIQILTGTCVEKNAKNIDRAKELLNGEPDAKTCVAASIGKKYIGKNEQLILGKDISSRFFGEIYDKLRQEASDLDWILPGLWFRKMTWMLAGDPDVGKTTYLLQQVRRLSRGEPVFAGAYMPTKKYKISYYVADASKSVSANANVKKLGMSWSSEDGVQFISGHQIRDEFFKLTGQTFSLGDQNGFDMLREMVKKNSSDILIIDTLGGGLTKEDENKPSEISPIMSSYRALAEELNVLLIIVHHFRKRGTDAKNKSAYRELEDVAGSKSIYGQCDSVLSIEKRFDEFGKHIPLSGIVRVLKTGAAGGIKKFPEIFFDITNPTDDRVEIVDYINAAEDMSEDIDKIILRCIKQGEDSFRKIFEKVQHGSGVSLRSLEREIKALKSRALITTTGHSRNIKYTLTKEGMEYMSKIELERIIEKSVVVERSEFDLSYDPDGAANDEIARLKEEIRQLTEWDLSYEHAPLDMKEKIDEFLAIDEWTGYTDARDEYTYNLRRVDRCSSIGELTHFALQIAHDNNTNNSISNELISRKKLNCRMV